MAGIRCWTCSANCRSPPAGSDPPIDDESVSAGTDTGSTVYIPTAIFDFDVKPSSKGPQQIDPGTGVPKSTF